MHRNRLSHTKSIPVNSIIIFISSLFNCRIRFDFILMKASEVVKGESCGEESGRRYDQNTLKVK